MASAWDWITNAFGAAASPGSAAAKWGAQILDPNVDLIKGIGPNEGSRANARPNNGQGGAQDGGNQAQSGAQAAAAAPQLYQGSYQGGGGGAAKPAVDQNQVALYDQSIGTLEGGLGRLDNQLGIARSNIDSQFNQRQNELNSSFDKSKNQYNTSTTKNGQNLRTNKNTIADQQSGGLRGLMRMLGAAGAVGSDIDLASAAVTDQASQQRSGAGQTFASNQAGLDTNWKNFQGDVDNERKKVNDWRSQQQQQAEQQSLQARQDLLTRLAQLRGEKAAYQGGSAASAAQSGLNEANGLSGRIDSLGRINPSYDGKSVNYTDRALDSYQIGGDTRTAMVNQQGTDPRLAMLLGGDQDELKQNPYL
ncbi:hypothetical protein I8H89_00310 [Candidatus Saccharibacteria bacterium]|nr:hypothetical protein [Candidatus Saccharibacteria bacterium]